LFEFNSSLMKKDGHNKELVKMQNDYLSDLNKEIKYVNLGAESNLEVIELDPVADILHLLYSPF
jgi:hypothetical protein